MKIEKARLEIGGTNAAVNGPRVRGLHEFMDKNPNSDFLLVIDTHSDYVTGGLVYGQWKDGCYMVAPINAVRI
jgi:hypothetical protein